METFTEAYQKGVGLLKGKCFDARWSHIEVRIKALLAPHGPNDGAAGVLDLIRDELEAAGAALVLHQQAIDTTTPAGRMFFQVTGAFAEFERVRDKPLKC